MMSSRDDSAFCILKGDDALVEPIICRHLRADWDHSADVLVILLTSSRTGAFCLLRRQGKFYPEKNVDFIPSQAHTEVVIIVLRNLQKLYVGPFVASRS